MTIATCSAAILSLALALIGDSGATEPPDLPALLAQTLSSLTLDNPLADLEVNLKAGDKRFICTYGYTRIVPTAYGVDNALVKRFGMKCLDGTSDAVMGSEHERLIREAIDYARTYNTELLRRIQSGLVT